MIEKKKIGEEEILKGNKLLLDQLKLYKKYDLMVHIVKTNERWYNGSILEIASDFLILDDRILGAMPIYFIEIDTLEKFSNEVKA